MSMYITVCISGINRRNSSGVLTVLYVYLSISFSVIQLAVYIADRGVHSTHYTPRSTFLGYSR